MNLSETVRGQQSDPTALIRLLLAAVFAVGEILIISLLFDPDWQSRILQKLLYLQYFVRQLALLCITSALAFVIISWPKRHVIVESWLAQVRPGGWHLLFVANIALFVGLTIATVEFSRYTSAVDQPPWGLYSAYLVLLAATGLSLILLVAPFSFWRQLLSHHRLQIAMAVVAGLIATLAGVLTQSGWGGLANVTLRVSYRLLSLYESDARVDYDKLGVKFQTYDRWTSSGARVPAAVRVSH